jgi:hypothetical protein
MMRSTGIGLLALLVTMGGCGPAGTPGSGTGRDQEASTESDVSTFYSTRPDYRRCPWPACGGSWVKRVNRDNTRCADGTFRSECYVVEVQNSTGLSDVEWQAARGKPHIVRADMTTTDTPRGPYGALRASEIWNAFDGETAVGTYFQISDNQIRCFTVPCFSLHEARLNSATQRELSGMDGRLGTAAGEALAKGKIIVQGQNQSQSGGGKAVAVNQLFIRAEQHSPLCAEYTTTDGRFYAKNFAAGQDAEAQAWVAADPQVFSSGIGIGTCGAMNEKPCDPQDPPVCGIPAKTDVAANYASLCEYRKVIRDFADQDGESKGKFTEGPCQEYCATARFVEEDRTYFYAQSFLWQESAQAWLDSAFAAGTDKIIAPGLCGAQPECVTFMYAPVCGTVRDLQPATYDAPCRFFNAVTKDAGSGESKGWYTAGSCPAQSGWVTGIDTTVSLAWDERLTWDLVVPPAATSVEITTSGGSGDADLYVLQGGTPTEDLFDCRSWNWGNTESCTFTAGGVTYGVMLLGYDPSADVHLVARYYLP